MTLDDALALGVRGFDLAPVLGKQALRDCVVVQGFGALALEYVEPAELAGKLGFEGDQACAQVFERLLVAATQRGQGPAQRLDLADVVGNGLSCMEQCRFVVVLDALDVVLAGSGQGEVEARAQQDALGVVQVGCDHEPEGARVGVVVDDAEPAQLFRFEVIVEEVAHTVDERFRLILAGIGLGAQIEEVTAHVEEAVVHPLHVRQHASARACGLAEDGLGERLVGRGFRPHLGEGSEHAGGDRGLVPGGVGAIDRRRRARVDELELGECARIVGEALEEVAHDGFSGGGLGTKFALAVHPTSCEPRPSPGTPPVQRN